MTKSHWKCPDYHPQMFISITDFDIEKTDDSHILITLIDSMGQPEKTKRFDKINNDFGKWIQDGLLTTGARKILVAIWQG